MMVVVYHIGLVILFPNKKWTDRRMAFFFSPLLWEGKSFVLGPSAFLLVQLRGLGARGHKL